MPTTSVSSGPFQAGNWFGLHSTAKLKAKGYVQVTGIKEVRRFMLHTAKDYRTYNSWMKRGAEIVASEGRRLAPLESSKLARSIVGRASARVASPSGGSRRTLIGGVVAANTPYGKSVSFGRYYPFGFYTIKRSKTGPPFRGFRDQSIRSASKNTYLKRARENSKPNVVALWNRLLRNYIIANGYDYQLK